MAWLKQFSAIRKFIILEEFGLACTQWFAVVYFSNSHGPASCHRNWIAKFKGDPNAHIRLYGEMYK